MFKIIVLAIALFTFPLSATAGKLLDAVKAGSLPEAEGALSEGADINEKSGFLTPLIAAVRATNREMVGWLLDHGADPNKAAGSNIPLSVAAGKNDPGLVELLLKNGADPRSAGNTMTSLHRAAESGCLKCVELLVAAGADVNALTAEGTPAIHLAKLAKDEDIAKYLFEHGYHPPVLIPVSPSLKTADAAKGKSIFERTCNRCHRLSGQAHAPPLGGIVGRAKAGLANQAYSAAMREAGGVWTYEDLSAFIANPPAFVPGTSMGFAGLSDHQERADLILYLRSESSDPSPLPD